MTNRAPVHVHAALFYSPSVVQVLGCNINRMNIPVARSMTCKGALLAVGQPRQVPAIHCGMMGESLPVATICIHDEYVILLIYRKLSPDA